MVNKVIQNHTEGHEHHADHAADLHVMDNGLAVVPGEGLLDLG
jgi:hypothetical protein